MKLMQTIVGLVKNNQMEERSFLYKIKLHRRCLPLRFFFTKVSFTTFCKIFAAFSLIIYSASMVEASSTIKNVPVLPKQAPEKKPPAKPAEEAKKTSPNDFDKNFSILHDFADQDSLEVDGVKEDPKLILQSKYDQWVGKDKSHDIAALLPADITKPTDLTKPVLLNDIPAAEEDLLEEKNLSDETLKALEKINTQMDKVSKKNSGDKEIIIEHGETNNPFADTKEDDGEYSEDFADVGLDIQIKKTPTYLAKLFQDAHNAVTSGQNEAAITLYNQILKKSPKNKTALFGIAVAYQKNSQIKEAKEYYSKLLKLDPNNMDALNNYLVVVGEESPEEAVKEFVKIEKKNPRISSIPAQIAMLHLKMENFNQAAEYMAKALTLSPTNNSYRYTLAVIFDKMGNYQQASRLYYQVLEKASAGEKIPQDSLKIEERLSYLISVVDNKNGNY